MFEKLSSWLKSETTAPTKTDDRHELAEQVAGLLVEAGLADGDLGDDERKLIAIVIAEKFDVSDTDAERVLTKSIADAEMRIDLYGLTSKLRAECDYEDRIEIIELVWMVVLSDAVVDDIEAQLMRRLAGLLYIADVDSGNAQKRARTRLGLV